MPSSTGQTVSFGAQNLPVYQCSYGCSKRSADAARIIEHELAERERPPILHVDSPSAGSMRWQCGGCKYRGEQPFDIYVHQCPLATFHCPKRPSEPKVRKERQHSYGSDAASIGSTA